MDVSNVDPIPRLRRRVPCAQAANPDALNCQRNQAGLLLGYDRACFDISPEESAERAAKGEPYVVRLKVDHYPMFDDLVYSKTGQNRAGKKVAGAHRSRLR